jgi:hypothetical protein
MKRIRELVKRAATLTYRKCVNEEADYRHQERQNAKQIIKYRQRKDRA